MFEFVHDIIEYLILRAASSGLAGWQRALMQYHLRSCMRCRAFALNLVEFSHALEPEKKSERLHAAEKDELHARVMAAFEREIREERMAPPFERAAGPLIRPSFIRAMATLSIILGAAFALSTPLRQPKTGLRGQASAQLKTSEALQALDPQPSPTPTPSAPKTENK